MRIAPCGAVDPRPRWGEGILTPNIRRFDRRAARRSEASRFRRVAALQYCEPEVRLAGDAYVDVEPTGACADGHLVSAKGWPGLAAFMRECLRVLGTPFSMGRSGRGRCGRSPETIASLAIASLAGRPKTSTAEAPPGGMPA
jgi:hypothetical protein